MAQPTEYRPPVFGWSKDWGSVAAKVAGYIPVVGTVVAIARACFGIKAKVSHKMPAGEGYPTIARCVIESIPGVNTVVLPIADLVQTTRREFHSILYKTLVNNMIKTGRYKEAKPALLELIQKGEGKWARLCLANLCLREGTDTYDADLARRLLSALPNDKKAQQLLRDLDAKKE